MVIIIFSDKNCIKLWKSFKDICYYTLWWFKRAMLPSVGGTIWGHLGGVALLEQIFTGDRFWKLKASPYFRSVSFLCACIEDVSAQPPAPGAWHATCHQAFPWWWTLIPLEPLAQINSSFYKLLWSWCSTIAMEKGLSHINSHGIM